ncbi:MAG: hypothetical protein KGY74_11235 [Candidatus Cloacimonetes bacterium]|nr:hypothetical protein [Candidatus Cloacimonadota bacterium]
MKQINLLVINTLSLIFALVLNGLAGSGVFNGKSVGDISARYDTLIAPAGYAFAIWGIIYLLLILFVGYQWYAWLRNRDDTALKQTGFWFALGNIANGLWIVAWLNEYMGLSVLLIFILLFSLIMLTLRLRLEIWDAPLRTIGFVWWPICIYLGWIVVASVANVAAYLVSLNWQGGFLSPSTWTVIMIAVATVIYLLLTFTRNMREAGLVGVWAFIAIAVRQWSVHDGIVFAALAGAGILLIVTSWHGYKNRATSPFEKLSRG